MAFTQVGLPEVSSDGDESELLRNPSLRDPPVLSFILHEKRGRGTVVRPRLSNKLSQAGV